MLSLYAKPKLVLVKTMQVTTFSAIEDLHKEKLGRCKLEFSSGVKK